MAGKQLTWGEQYAAQPRAEWTGNACVICGREIPDYRGLDRVGKPIPATTCLPCLLIRRPGEARAAAAGPA